MGVSCIVLKAFVVGGFVDNYYWSSAEVSSTNARTQNFNGNFHYVNNKSVNLRVSSIVYFEFNDPV